MSIGLQEPVTVAIVNVTNGEILACRDTKQLLSKSIKQKPKKAVRGDGGTSTFLQSTVGSKTSNQKSQGAVTRIEFESLKAPPPYPPPRRRKAQTGRTSF